MIAKKSIIHPSLEDRGLSRMVWCLRFLILCLTFYWSRSLLIHVAVKWWRRRESNPRPILP